MIVCLLRLHRGLPSRQVGGADLEKVASRVEIPVQCESAGRTVLLSIRERPFYLGHRAASRTSRRRISRVHSPDPSTRLLRWVGEPLDEGTPWWGIHRTGPAPVLHERGDDKVFDDPTGGMMRDEIGGSFMERAGFAFSNPLSGFVELFLCTRMRTLDSSRKTTLRLLPFSQVALPLGSWKAVGTGNLGFDADLASERRSFVFFLRYGRMHDELDLEATKGADRTRGALDPRKSGFLPFWEASKEGLQGTVAAIQDRALTVR